MERLTVQNEGFISRRGALALLGAAVAAVRYAGAAEQAIMQPVSLDHVNIRVANVVTTAQFYMELFDTPVLRNPAMRAQPTSPPSEGFFLKFGDGYLVMTQAFAPERSGLDHYSLGLRDYEKAALEAKLKDNGTPAEPRRSGDMWLADPDGSLMQLRPPGGWARQTATPYQPTRTGPALLPLSMSRIALSSAELGRSGDFYRRLFGTEIALPALGGSRAFSVGDAVLELVSAPVPSSAAPGRGLDHIRIAVRDFTVETATRILRERGIATSVAPEAVRFADPDGIRIELAAAS
jgi:catechol 2,3-dioxygenase-like lactoylglutathione lyase family enzyme/predicted enzyme related to lactoylglutathione lyase